MSAIPDSDRLVEFLFRLWSSFYDQPIFQRPFYRRVHASVLEAIGTSSPQSVVDIGCGTAQLTDDLAKRFAAAQVVGVDLSKDMLGAARRRLGDHAPPLFRANVYALPLAPATADLVTSTISYHWYREPDRALAEIRRILRPGGRFVLATLATRILRGTVGGARLATSDDIAGELEAAGFRIVKKDRVRPAVQVFAASTR